MLPLFHSVNSRGTPAAGDETHVANRASVSRCLVLNQEEEAAAAPIYAGEKEASEEI